MLYLISAVVVIYLCLCHIEIAQGGRSRRGELATHNHNNLYANSNILRLNCFAFFISTPSRLLPPFSSCHAPDLVAVPALLSSSSLQSPFQSMLSTLCAQRVADSTVGTVALFLIKLICMWMYPPLGNDRPHASGTPGRPPKLTLVLCYLSGARVAAAAGEVGWGGVEAVAYSFEFLISQVICAWVNQRWSVVNNIHDTRLVGQIFIEAFAI